MTRKEPRPDSPKPPRHAFRGRGSSTLAREGSTAPHIWHRGPPSPVPGCTGLRGPHRGHAPPACPSRGLRGAHLPGRNSRPCGAPHRGGCSPGGSRCPCRVSRSPGTPCSRGSSWLEGQRQAPEQAHTPRGGERGGQRSRTFPRRLPPWGPRGARLPGRAGRPVALTAELGGPPVAGLAAGVGALAGELGQGAAGAGGAVGAAAAVLHAGPHERRPRYQPLAGLEGRGLQQLLALGALQTRRAGFGDGPCPPLPAMPRHPPPPGKPTPRPGPDSRAGSRTLGPAPPRGPHTPPRACGPSAGSRTPRR